MYSLQDLAPAHLANYRARRYHGDDVAFDLLTMTTGDQQATRELYSLLQQLHAVVAEGSADERLAATLHFLAAHSLDAWTAEIVQLGRESYAAQPSPFLAKTLHDIRGGGLTPLIGLLQFLVLSPSPDDVESVYFYTRDHLKIMRNALLGLDDVRRNQDLELKAHDTQLLVQKHDGALIQSFGHTVRLEVECLEHAAISECCIEFGALDRVLYNLINNACRHTAEDTLHLTLLPVPQDEHENLRIVLVNTVKPADALYLRGLDLATLFTMGVSSTGSGAGLNIAAHFVANAFGLPSPEAAVAGHYLGAKLVEDQFIAWFHWPILEGY